MSTVYEYKDIKLISDKKSESTVLWVSVSEDVFPSICMQAKIWS